MLSLNEKRIFLILVTIIYISYFLGFYLNENSIGSGGYNGDLVWMWRNFELFKNNNLIQAINHKDFFGNRTPLLYIINIIFNPFINNIYFYRLSITLFSLIGPIIFYSCLRKKYKNIDKEILLLISSLILLSPFYRTTAYWGMEINYAIITAFITLNYFISITRNNENFSLKNVFLLIFFSSLTVYFDQKLIIIPILVFLKIILKKKQLKTKITTVLVYFLFALPYIYLLYIWGGIVPQLTQVANLNTITNISRINNLYFYHLGYASTIIAFYFFPFLFMKENNFFIIIKEFFLKKVNYFFLLIPLLYIFFIILNYSFKEYTIDNYWIGLGLTHKISLIFFSSLKSQEIFTYVSFCLSWLIIILVLENKIYNILILFYFFLIAIFVWPLMQEYFDPIISIFALLVFKTKIKFNYKNTLFLFLYLSTFLIASNIYYSNII